MVGAAAPCHLTRDATINGGLLDVSAYASSVNSLTIDSGTLNLGLANTLSAAKAVTLGGTIEIAGTADNGIATYTLITSGSAISGSLAGAIAAVPNPSFAIQVDATGRNLIYQHLATLDTPTLAAASATIITGGATALVAGFRNSAPPGSANLSFNQGYANPAVTGYDASQQILAASGPSGGYASYPAIYQGGARVRRH